MINPQWGFNPIIKNNKNYLRSYIISTFMTISVVCNDQFFAGTKLKKKQV
jgi:hypothetical protein